MGALLIPALAGAHVIVAPAVSDKLQLYSLGVPTEKRGLTTSAIALTQRR